MVTMKGMVVSAGPMLAVIERLGLSERLFAICKENHALIEHVLLGRREPSVVRARAACAAHLRTLGMSTPEIARLLGFNHASSVGHAIRRHKQQNGDGNGQV